VIALVKLFDAAGVTVTEAEARVDMGRAKIDHIRTMLTQPRISAAWAARHGAAPAETDVVRMFDGIGPMMRAAAADCAALIPGAAEVACQLQAAGVKVGSCTGYSRDMMVDILPRAAEQGYRPDMVVCAGETPEGRPSPLMVWKNLVELGAWPATNCVKVDDAEVGIAEGRAAGLWTVGVAASGNAIGLSRDDLAMLESADRAARVGRARRLLMDAGAHLVIDSVADLPAALRELPIGKR
jgi:phosphonoacetaldehyde hydrolase